MGLWKGESDEGGLSEVLEVPFRALLEFLNLLLKLGEALMQVEQIGLYGWWGLLPIGLRQRLRRH